MVRELSQAPVCFLFDCCIFIGRFVLTSCYSAAKTRVGPVILYQHYDMTDMERDTQRALRGIQDHQEIVKQYQKVVRI